MSDEQRVAVVCRLFGLLERGEVPGHDLLTEHAQALDAAFNELGGEREPLADRLARVVAAAPERRVAVREVYAVPDGRVLALAVVVRPGAAEEVAFIFAFDGARIRSGRAVYNTAAAFTMVGLELTTADRVAARRACTPS